jgi:hypothetical protein
MAGLCHVNSVFEQDYGVIVGERDTGATERRGSPRNPLRRGGIREDISVAGFTDIPVLAKLTGQITPGCAKRQDGRPGQEVMQGLFLDRVDTEAARTPISRQHDLIVVPRPHKAKAPLPFVEPTIPRAQVALHPSIVKLVPIGGRHHGRKVRRRHRSLLESARHSRSQTRPCEPSESSRRTLYIQDLHRR